MPRVRWAQKCRARRDGKPCGAWSVRGTFVCAAHGGRAPQVRYQGKVRLLETRLRRDFDRDWAEYRHRYREWQIDRIMTAARLLNMAPEDVDWLAIVRANVLHGRPGLSDQAPQPVIRHDGRLRRFIANPR